MIVFLCALPSVKQNKGVKGACILSLHSPFDLVRGTVVDSLHCIFLGVASQLLSLWFDKKNRADVFYIGNKVWILVIVNERRCVVC